MNTWEDVNQDIGDWNIQIKGFNDLLLISGYDAGDQVKRLKASKLPANQEDKEANIYKLQLLDYSLTFT